MPTAAQALSTKAAQKELTKDFDAAFELHVKAAESFIHLAQTLPDPSAKASCKTAAGKALERAEQIKKVKRDVKPVAADPYSIAEQAYILDRSSLVNGHRFSPWQDADTLRGEEGSELYRDQDGQPALAQTLQTGGVSWRRPTAALPTPLRIVDTTLLPEDLVQSVVTDCSVVAAISVCLGHQRRFGSKLGLSSLYPQDKDGVPLVSASGKYTVRVFFNGTWRKVLIDDALPFLETGQFLGVSTGEHQVLWPPLVEKAYMKLMGGYDFPGSNSGTDLHTLIGWIPEHVHIRSAEFRMEGTWSRILQGFSKGQCLVTLGTPPSLGRGLKYHLLPAHNYAVSDMEDDGNERYMTLLDPWRQASTSDSVTSGVVHDLHNTNGLPGPLRLAWGDICMHFDTIHLNWDPSLFPRQFQIHGIWKAPKTLSTHAQSVTNRLRLHVQRVQSRDSEIWVLLTRHVVGKHEPQHFISLNAVLHDNLSINAVDRPSVYGTYTDSANVLHRFSPGLGDSIITVVASLEGADVDVRYTISILSNVDVTLDRRPPKGLHSKTIIGSLTVRSSGGNHTYPTFMTNPQYRLHLRPNATGEGSNANTRTPLCFSAKGPRDLPLNVKIVWSNGQRVTELIEGDVVADTGAYSYGVAYGERDLKAGQYTIIVSSFEPRQQGTFELSLHSLRAFDLELLPAEGAGMYPKTLRGAWTLETSAGSPSFGRYPSNPAIKVSVPNPMHIMIRMQLLQPSPSVALNLSLFAMDASGEPSVKILSSGSYSDVVAGVLLPHSAIAAGNYILVPSTYTSGVEAGFQILLYSTRGGVEMSWLRH